MERTISSLAVLVWIFCGAMALAGEKDGNRLTYLDEFLDPYYVGREFPKLATPQWVGDEGVEAVVVLAIDDMRDPAKYEAFLRPILDRLKQIDGRAPVSIMTCQVDPQSEQLQTWLKEGLSIEIHTIDHPCPCLAGGDFAKAKSTFDRCVDLMNEIKGNKPVAFRMPCCDSKNTPSPRFWAEAFNKTTEKGNFLSIDSSVFNIITAKDKSLPKEITLNEKGEERFRRYLPFPSFVNTIDDYPYPYVIGRLCWQFPCVVPSDWSAQHVQKPNNPDTVRDLKLALDATVIKQGVYNLVFHPHGWIRNDQVVEIIDHAVAKHGKKVKFLSFRECQERLDKNLLAGQPLRNAKGEDNGVRILDVDNDGYMDVVIGNDKVKTTRVWQPNGKSWSETRFPAALSHRTAFGVLSADGNASFFNSSSIFSFQDGEWRNGSLGAGIPATTSVQRPDGRHLVTQGGQGFRDIDGDGCCEVISGRDVYGLNRKQASWQKLPYRLPLETLLFAEYRGDVGVRFVDVNADARDDILFSNDAGYGLFLFASKETGWSIRALSGKAGEPGAIPLIVRGAFSDDGKERPTNNGAWFHSGHLWVQNEDTQRLPDGVDRRSFADLLKPLKDREAKLKAPSVPIGAAKIDVTPDYPIRLQGYAARATESEGVEHKIWAKALAIGDDKSPAILVTLDNLGVPISITDEVAARLAKKVGLARERFAICASHTHAGPALAGVAPTVFGKPIPAEHVKHIEQYTAELTDKLEQVCLDALAARRPGRLAWSQGKVGFAANRRTPGGPVDHSVPLLKATDEEGKLIALLVNYACHCTTLGPDINRICGDWAGYAQEYIEADQPGAVAMIAIGCGADANPKPRTGLPFAKQHGRALADEVKRILKEDFSPIDAIPVCKLQRVELPFDKLPTREEWEQKAKQGGAVGYHAQVQLARLDKGEKLRTSLSYPIGTWTFGDDLAMVFLAGEVVVDYSIRLKTDFDGRRLWVNAYANDAPCYIPSKRIWREGGYEGGGAMIYYDQPTRLAEGVEDIIVDAVQRLLGHRYYSQAKLAEFPPPKTPDQSLASIELRPGFKVELVAAEPLIVDPVAFDWGPDGRLWVVEMHDYPDGLDGKGKPGGRVKVLTDEDGDGKYDKAALFLDGIPFPTGVKVWRNGILVTAAPDIFYAEDADGDGKAEIKKTLYQGFGEGNQQHRVNGLVWGLDNWLYVGNGDSGGTIKSLQTGSVVNVGGRDLRIRPDEGLLDAQSGQTQYGRCRDEWGNWFGGNNSDPLWHYVLEDHYLRRNPHVAPPSVRVQVPVQPGAAPVFPISKTLARFNDFDRANRFTSACSPHIYRDELFGPEFVGNSFVCEPVHNLVHREIVSAKGITFTSKRASDEQQSEFLASSDNWFRPSMVRTGPDGAVWVSDMYRFVIEHPKWIPAEWQRKLDLRAGDDMGRIYRVYSEKTPPRKFTRLDKLDTPGLVAALDSPNGWQRDMAQQMLIWKGDKSAMLPLERLAANSKRPEARLHALCTLDGLGELRADIVVLALVDAHPGVRRHAVRVAEPMLDMSRGPGEILAELDERSDSQLQMQIAYSLGAWRDPRAGRLLATLALRHKADPYLSAAVMSSVNKQNLGDVLSGVLAGSEGKPPPERIVEQLFAVATALGDKAIVGRVIDIITKPAEGKFAPWQMAALAGMLDVLDRRQTPLDKLLSDRDRQSVGQIVGHARIAAASEKASLEERLTAVRLLGRGLEGQDAERELLASLLAPQNAVELQRAAVASLGRMRGEAMPKLLLAGWTSHTPTIRSQVLDVLLAREETVAALLATIQRGEIPATQLDARRRQQLLGHKNESLRARAAQLLAGAGDANRKKVLDEHQNVLTLPGDVTRGKAVYAKRCANCHRLDGEGHPVGPDLAALTDKSPGALLLAMLDPSRAVEDRYLDYAAITSAGLQVSGMLASETGTSITLAGPDGKQTTILRGDLEILRSTGKSLMPEGLEKDATRQELADVIAYLRGSAAPPKKFENNKPEVVKPFVDGSIRLLAMNCKIYGPTLVFEQQYRNLGYWQSAEDHAIWTFETPAAGEYRVVLDYACENGTAGNAFTLSVAGQSLGGKVEGTLTWDNYKGQDVGIVKLPAGASDLVIRSDGAVKGALFDLRSIRLVPVK